LEVDDSSQNRLEKIYRLLSACKYGVHDLSRTGLDRQTGLPRFNMPLELGIFLGAKRFGDARQRRKSCLILDRDPYRYHSFRSDISGQDIKAHANNTKAAIRAVRTWLQAAGEQDLRIPGSAEMENRYMLFRDGLPELCRRANLEPKEPDLTFIDFRTLL